MKQAMSESVSCDHSNREEHQLIAGPRRAADVMTKAAMTLGPEQSFAEAVTLMANRSFRHILIVDEDERLHGVVSDRDVLRALARTPNWKKKVSAKS